MRTCHWLRPALALGTALLLTLVPASARLSAQDARERTLYVSAVDAMGEPVTGLGTEAFIVREDGVKREVLRVSQATEPIDIALLVDNSRAAEHDLTFIRNAVSKFVAAMSTDNPIAVIGLAERPTILADYTNDPKRLATAVGRIFATPGSGMTLLDAVVEVTKGLDKREDPRAAIIAVITDGPEFTTRFSRDVTNTLTRAHVPMYAVTVGQFYYSDEHDTRERVFLLDEGPRESGGTRIPLVSANGIEPALLKIGRELKAQYKVVYSRPESLIPPQKVDIASGRAGVTMRGAPARGQNGG
jgi:VWFA-related protein